MSHVRGMRVTLQTASSNNSGTSDPIYIGIAGPGGGREFPLNTPGDDFEEGRTETFVLGTVFENTPDPKKPVNSEPGRPNDPEKFRIELDEINQVYIRKQERSVKDGKDDAYQLDDVKVELYGRPIDSPQKRTFKVATGDNVWLGNEFGHQAWLV